MLPPKAEFEASPAPGIALWDVSADLPQPKRWYRKKKRPKGEYPRRLFTHHSGATRNTDDAWMEVFASVNFAMRQRDFKVRPYHFAIPRNDIFDDAGRRVMFRLAPDDERCWHTGGRANDEGWGVVWMGQLNPKLDFAVEPTHHQIECAEAFYPWMSKSRGLVMPMQFSYHSEGAMFGGRRKAACPGSIVEAWVDRYRDGLRSGMMRNWRDGEQ